MKTTGLRGKYSPMHDATPEQRTAIEKLLVEARSEADSHYLFEVRYPVWIGAGFAADRKAITVCIDGKIAWNVELDGTLT